MTELDPEKIAEVMETIPDDDPIVQHLRTGWAAALAPRESRVLEMIEEGCSLDEIARTFNVSVAKVESVRKGAVQKLAYQHKDTPESFWERMREIHGPDVGP